MSAEESFLAALRANPADDTARLVYADWLDDRDEPAKAEYLRAVSRLAGAGFGGPCVATEERLRELEAALPADWTTAAGAAFEVAFLGLASSWWLQLGEALTLRFPLDIYTRRVLYDAAPAVLADGLRAGDALGAAADMNGWIATAVHNGATRGEYAEVSRDMFVAQVEKTGRSPFAAYPTGWRTEPPLSRFEVVAVDESGTWRRPHTHQNPEYLVAPLCSLLGVGAEEVAALLYTSVPCVVRPGLAFAAAVEGLAELRRALKRHHLARPLTETVQLVVRAEPHWSDPAGGYPFS